MRAVAGVGGVFEKPGDGGLDDAVADDPGGHEGADLVKRPAELAVEKHRHADHEPHVPRREQEDTGGRQEIDFPGFGKKIALGDLLLGFAQIGLHDGGGETQDDGEAGRH